MDLSVIASLLEATLDPRHNKQAEQHLREQEVQSGYSIALLHIVASTQYSQNVRLASALYFKNFIKRSWTDDDGQHKLAEEEVETIKREIIGLMINSPTTIQAQLGDAVGIIADSDFFRKWDTLVPDLVSRLGPPGDAANIGVLTVAHSIFKRWRPLYRSDELFTEINHVLDHFGKPLLSLLAQTDAQISSTTSDKSRLVTLFSTINLLFKIVYDICCQDLPPIIEDHSKDIAGLLGRYVVLQNSILDTNDDDEMGQLEIVKSSAFETFTLFATKYEDCFSPFIPEFTQISWSFLTGTGLESKHDIVVSKALHFLTSVSQRSTQREAFNSETTLDRIVSDVIIPNVTLRDSDVETFEDEPIEYIRRDLEGSDSDTRRRAATDLLRSLLENLTQLVTAVVSRHVMSFMQAYSQNPKANWKEKDTAVHLFASIAALGAITARDGVKTVNPETQILDFFQNYLAGDLNAEGQVHPITQVSAIKFLYIFRSQLNAEQWDAAFPHLSQKLASDNYVVYTYTAIVIERVLALHDTDGRPFISRATLQPLAPILIQNLLKLITAHTATDTSVLSAKVQENEFLIRCIMRILTNSQSETSKLVQSLIGPLTKLTELLCVNPSNPKFCYYHFESLGALIRFAEPAQLEAVATTLRVQLMHILQNDVVDFVPYAIQLFGALIEADPSASSLEAYDPLTVLVLKVDLWLVRGNTPALVRLLSAMIRKKMPGVITQIEPTLGIFQQILSSKSGELYALDFLFTILSNYRLEDLTQYYTQIFRLVLEKLFSSNVSEGFKSRFVRFYHNISSMSGRGMGPDFFMNIVETIYEGIYVKLYLTIVLPGTPKLARPLDRKVAIISLTKTLSDSPAFAEKYKKGWTYSCDRLLELLINPPVIHAGPETITDNDVEDTSFGVGFTQLVTIQPPPLDTFPEITDVKSWVGQFLKTADANQNGRIGQFVRDRLSPESQSALLSVMNVSG